MEEEADILRTAGKQIFPMTISRNPAMKPINMMKEKSSRALSKSPAIEFFIVCHPFFLIEHLI